MISYNKTADKFLVSKGYRVVLYGFGGSERALGEFATIKEAKQAVERVLNTKVSKYGDDEEGSFSMPGDRGRPAARYRKV